MKRFIKVALSLGIILMLASPTAVWGQNRRTNNSSQKTQQSSSNRSSSSSATKSSNTSNRSSSSATRSSNTSNRSSVSRSSSSDNRKSATSTSTTRQIQDHRTTTTPSRSATTTRTTSTPRTTTTTRTTSTSTKRTTSTQDRPATTPSRTTSTRRTTSTSSPDRNTISTDRQTTNTTRSSNSSNRTRVNSTEPRRTTSVRTQPSSNNRGDVSHDKPNAIQYHNTAPAPRGKDWQRPYLQHNKPMPSYRYGSHYFGHRCDLPHGARPRPFGSINYYYYNGIYYRPYYMGGYVVCRPPIGSYYATTMLDVALTAAVINSMIDAAQRARYAEQLAQYYALQNTSYRVRDVDNYVTNVANQNDQYYYQEGVFYVMKNGQYYVIEPPIGALVTQLPEDYEEVVLNDNTYYQVESTLYKVTVIEGALYFEVVCNL